MKTKTTLLLTTSTLLLSLLSPSLSAAEKQKVLMILSSYGEKDSNNELIKPGFEMDELAKAYLVFEQHGLDVSLASPKGGQPVADNFNTDKAYNKAFMQNEEAVKKLHNTLAIAEVKPEQYSSVFVVGGKGPMFDLPDNPAVQNVIKTIYENQGVVGAVCHGPAALLKVKLSNGEWLVANKRVSGFTLEEEDAFSKKWAKEFPFQLETQLKAQGAQFVQDGLMLNQVSIDGRVITGQNPFSTTDTAKAMVKKLGLALKDQPKFKDDETILLVERYFADSQAASTYYAAHSEQYDTMLLAMFGYYQSQHATTQAQRAVAIKIMEDTSNTVKHPMLTLELANAYERSGQSQTAKTLLENAVAQFPDNDSLKAKLKAL